MKMLHAKIVYSIFPLCLESNDLEKSTNKDVASRFFASMIRSEKFKIVLFENRFD